MMVITRAAQFAGFILMASAASGQAEEAGAGVWSLYGQGTVVEQYHPAFGSPYRGANSLDPNASGRETVDVTLFAGLRLWDGGEVFANPEIDQGFGLSNTLGVAAFPSGEAYKVGKTDPYFRLQRLFFRQTIDLGGDVEMLSSDQNQIAGQRTANHLIFTVGKFSVPDIFDANSYAHDPKSDFLNWAIIDSGAFDYAADAWGYSYGLAAEWTQAWWTLRSGLFDLSRVPNTTALVRGFGQYELVFEAEGRYAVMGQPGKLKLLGYYNRGRMGSYSQALQYGIDNGVLPGTLLVRRPASRPGVAVNWEQDIGDAGGVFARMSWNDGSEEAYEFTEINRSAAFGVSLKGDNWGRQSDTLGVAAVMSGISDSARLYFAAGGMGILIGDGMLPHYGNEEAVEAYYKVGLTEWLATTADYQFVERPAYNRDRGPVSIFSMRLHAQF